jgi:hypothetical protein
MEIEMEEKLTAAIKNVFNNEPSQFKDNVNDILMNKIGDQLSIQKMQMANSTFNNEEEPEEEESDEDIQTDN